MQADLGIIDEMFKVYPTVMEDKTTLDYIAPEEDESANISIYNMWGQKVIDKDVVLQKGFNRLHIATPTIGLATGMYHFVLQANGKSQTVKLIKE